MTTALVPFALNIIKVVNPSTSLTHFTVSSLKLELGAIHHYAIQNAHGFHTVGVKCFFVPCECISVVTIKCEIPFKRQIGNAWKRIFNNILLPDILAINKNNVKAICAKIVSEKLLVSKHDREDQF